MVLREFFDGLQGSGVTLADSDALRGEIVVFNCGLIRWRNRVRIIAGWVDHRQVFHVMRRGVIDDAFYLIEGQKSHDENIIAGQAPLCGKGDDVNVRRRGDGFDGRDVLGENWAKN